MSYEKKEWESGEIITADDLNHMENGLEQVADGTTPFVINATFSTDTSGVSSFSLGVFGSVLYRYISAGAPVKLVYDDPFGFPSEIVTFLYAKQFADRGTTKVSFFFYDETGVKYAATGVRLNSNVILRATTT